MTTRAFFKVCRVLIFLNKIVEKKHILNPEINLLYQFHAQKALFTVPKNCKINIWIENAPPPFELFRKFIRFGTAIRPLGKISEILPYNKEGHFINQFYDHYYLIVYHEIIFDTH